MGTRLLFPVRSPVLKPVDFIHVECCTMASILSGLLKESINFIIYKLLYYMIGNSDLDKGDKIIH